MRASMYPEKRRHATRRYARVWSQRLLLLCLLKLRVPFDKFFRSPPRKADRDAPVFVIAFDSHDGAHAVVGVPHLSSQQGINATLGCWPFHGAAGALLALCGSSGF